MAVCLIICVTVFLICHGCLFWKLAPVCPDWDHLPVQGAHAKAPAGPRAPRMPDTPQPGPADFHAAYVAQSPDCEAVHAARSRVLAHPGNPNHRQFAKTMWPSKVLGLPRKGSAPRCGNFFPGFAGDRRPDWQRHQEQCHVYRNLIEPPERPSVS